MKKEAKTSFIWFGDSRIGRAPAARLWQGQQQSMNKSFLVLFFKKEQPFLSSAIAIAVLEGAGAPAGGGRLPLCEADLSDLSVERVAAALA